MLLSFRCPFPPKNGAFLLLLVWPQVGSDKRRLRPDMCVVSQVWRVMFDICCCRSGVLSPTVRCVCVAVGEARCVPFRNLCVLCLIFPVVFQVSFPTQYGALVLLLVWPQVASDKWTPGQDTCRVSQFWRVMSDVCCCLSGVLSPTVRCWCGHKCGRPNGH